MDLHVDLFMHEELNARLLMVNRFFFEKCTHFLLWYNRVIPTFVQRIFEFLVLLKAVIMLLILIYAHLYSKQNVNGCIGHINVPKNSILRLEIIQPHERNYAELTGNIKNFYTLEESYNREMELRKLYDLKFISRSNRKKAPYDGPTSEECEHKASISKYSYFHKKDFIGLDSNGAEMCFPNKYPNSSLQQYHQKNVDNNSMDFYANIILEYSSKFNLLSLCPITRYETNVSVLYVPLEPFRSTCFGENIFIQHLLKEFNGYHHVLMHLIKTLQEKDSGYVRNCITREYYLFVDHMPLINSLIISLFCMSIFSYSILMVFRYFTKYVTNMIVHVIYWTAPGMLETIYGLILCTLLAMFGLKVLMNTFFQTDSIILIIMLLVWLTSQLSLLLFHHSMTRNYWLKFNYLYQFSFYVYYYRFNGQYSGLSLYVAWSFIEHSIVYFLQHYEIPYLVRHVTVYEAIVRRLQP